MSKKLVTGCILVGAFLYVVFVMGASYSPEEISFAYEPSSCTYKLLGGATVFNGEQLIIDVNAIDPDNDPISFSVTAKPVGLAINPNSGVINWTPTIEQLGLHYVDVVVRDYPPEGSISLSDSGTIVIQVYRTNEAPILFPCGG